MSLNCWNCSQNVSPPDLQCDRCDALLVPASTRNYFQVLGAKVSFFQDPIALEKAFKRLSRKVHPDRYATATPRERQFSLLHATELNDAYRTLRVPAKRAEYLLSLHGRNGCEHSRYQLPFEFLEEVLESREKIDKYRLGQDDESLEKELNQIHQRYQDTFTQLETLFQEFENGITPQEEPKILDRIEMSIHKLRYLEGPLTEAGMIPHQAIPRLTGRSGTHKKSGTLGKLF